ncbi:RNA-binding protein 7-like [Cricetulus griseus]|uniref:RNA-binding protein 7-like n=1 Tax=Cricetulus griseus TaxID=10029 RepID=UPI00022F3902|nr:RNA-binding protein 7-like [Cricetulus griseus]
METGVSQTTFILVGVKNLKRLPHSTLFLDNLKTKVTDELLFELFHQPWPVIKVKFPKDKDGKLKQFAFMNFKHEMSVPYAMNLLNGIKLFGRLIKTQFRSESSHASQDANVSYLQHRVGNLNPTSTSPNSYERAVGNMTPSAQMVQQSVSSSEDCQQQAVMNNVFRQMSYGGKFGFLHADQFSPSVQSHGHTFNQSFSSQWHQGALSLHKNASIRHALRKNDVNT